MQQKPHNLKQKSFTLIEVMIVIIVVAVLATNLFPRYTRGKDAAYKTLADSDMRVMLYALEMYKNDNNGAYPPDAARTIPVGIEQYLNGSYLDRWPDGPRPQSVYDRDYRPANSLQNPQEDVYQISIRFCPAGGNISTCKFPREKRAANFDENSAAYYCIQGPCRSHQSRPYNHPGYCINCPSQNQ